MTKKLLSLSLIALLMAPHMNAQQPIPGRSILLAQYLIDPVAKTVSRQGYWERDYPNGMHAWGTSYTVDEKIRFEITCLYVTDNALEFKEHYKPRSPDVIDDWGAPLDLSPYQRVIGDFYKQGRQHYYLASGIGRRQLRKLEIKRGVDPLSLTPAGQNFYFNDKGLYYVRSASDDMELVEIATGSKCQPVVHATYCVYNGVAYTADLLATSGPEKINADPAKLYEIDERRDGDRIFLTDGTTVFKSYHNPAERTVPGLHTWKQLSLGQAIKVEDDCAYLLGPAKGNSYDKLFYSPTDGFFSVDFPTFKKKASYRQVYIFNYDTAAYEEIDVSQFELHRHGFYAYRGVRNPMGSNLDTTKLRFLNKLTGPAKWMSDGKYLIHLDTRVGTGREVSYGPDIVIINIKALKVASEKLLVDDVNFYQFNGRAIEIIPIKSLGIEVKFDLSTYAWSDGSGGHW